MATYRNCYNLVESVRRALNEYSTAYMQGTDTGHYDNVYIVEKINTAQRFIYNYLFKRLPEEFLEELDIVGVDSVYARPADYGKLVIFKTDTGLQVFPTTVDRLKRTNESGSDRHYYKKGGDLILDKSGITKTYTLFYYRKARDLDFGKSSAGEALALTLATSAKKIADYYNGMTIENVTDDWVDTISDYSDVRVATITTETGAADKYYGIVSDLPESFHDLIAPKAVLEIKGESVLSEEKPSAADIKNFRDNLRETLRAYAGPGLDEDVASLFEDFEP